MSREPPELDVRLTIALDRSWQAVEAQRDRLSDFRARAATLLSATSVTIGVAAGLAGSGDLELSDGWTRWSLVWFAVSVVCAVVLLLPRNWVFESDPTSFDWYFHNANAEELRSSLLADAQRHYRANHKTLRQLGWVLTTQVLSLGLTTLGVLSFVMGRVSMTDSERTPPPPPPPPPPPGRPDTGAGEIRNKPQPPAQPQRPR